MAGGQTPVGSTQFTPDAATDDKITVVRVNSDGVVDGIASADLVVNEGGE